ncbi:hypothetical protein V1358_08170 [Pseudoalteromonas sp. YIC-656]|uniref:hypothetical protein n=1 Tax=Pseudoalteromonas pernae TaxID=3118054 RepID=UPI0032428FE4
MSKIVTWLIIISACIYACNSVAAPLDIRLCYEDKEVIPFYLGEGEQVPSNNPGANIDILYALEKKSDVKFSFVRRPWMRCWEMLERQEADAVIASFRGHRIDQLNYPMKDGKLDTSRSLAQVGNCFIGTQLFHEYWRKKHVTENQPLSVAVPNGYAIAEKLESEPLLLHTVFSPKDGYRLLKNDRVHAVMGVCQVNGRNVYADQSGIEGVSPIYPPFEQLHGYIAVTPQFYKMHQPRIEALWDSVAEQDSTDMYLRYLFMTTLYK